jgi:hypothetical protein
MVRRSVRQALEPIGWKALATAQPDGGAANARERLPGRRYKRERRAGR